MSDAATTTAAATATSASVGAANPTACARLYELPTADAACAMPYGSNHTDIMTACCGDADVISYYDDCGLYCLAQGQTVNQLVDCMFAKGAPWQAVFCSGPDTNASATATGHDVPTSAQASVIATGKGASGASSTGSGDSTSTSTDAPGAAAGLRPEYNSVTTLGVTLGAILFSATAFGALLI
ncbi:uncharacterized protein GGS25DRAFT_132437 [Hypoxylon fragiforme]|uniref:uncharacterized protein n=1 Tax=Hypoxylon fragiforme TaxID=63214 RepID=UPI0020C6983F|nr:uncharacterized protein GGS25DRAFT_132437 [Hypoxylon fragiforme]KAI2612702.1 hypothetical protein GGS25DRAFT_132437 [Hypoxylon fragiforme]